MTEAGAERSGGALAALRAFSPVTRALALALIATLAIDLLLLAAGEGRIWKELSDFLRIKLYKPDNDSWFFVHKAWHWLHTNEGADKTIYQAVFFEQREKFQYPLTSLLIFEPLGGLSRSDFGLVIKLLNAVSWLSLAAMPFVLWRLLRAAIDAYAPEWRGSRVDAWAQLALLLPLTFMFFPLSHAVALGQVQAWLNLAFALAVRAWIANREAVSGALTAAVCLVKPQLGVLLIWGAMRKRWRFVLTAVAVGALGGLIALALYGWANNVDYLRVLSYLGTRGEAFYANNSVNGLLNRLVRPDLAAVFDGHGFPPENAVVRIGTMITTIGFVGAALFARWRRERSDAIDLAAGGLLITMASPIAWEHHYGVAAIGFVLALPAILAAPSRAKLALLAGAYVLCAHDFSFVRGIATAPLNIVQAYLFFGAAMLAWLLVKLPPFTTGGERAFADR